LELEQKNTRIFSANKILHTHTLYFLGSKCRPDI
jgi:hypothetical protein